MNTVSILMVILSAIFIVCSICKEQFVSPAYYALLFAILIEIGCIHDTLKEKWNVYTSS